MSEQQEQEEAPVVIAQAGLASASGAVPQPGREDED